jgi:hypothetical protein
MESGFPSGDISVLLRDHRSSRAAAEERATQASKATSPTTADRTFAFLGEINALAIPGIGPFIAVGPIMGSLAGVGSGGGLTRALGDMGIPEFEAKRYEKRIADGAVLLSVHCDNSVIETRARNLLKQMGGQDIASSGEAGAASGAATQDGPAAQV